MQELSGETLCKASELAAILGLSGRRVHQLAEDGVIIKVSRGRFNLADAVQRYCEYRVSAGGVEDHQIDLERRRADADMKAARATILKLEAAELEGNMHRSEDVAALTEDLIYTIRSALIALPGRLAMDAAAEDSPARVSEIIRKEVYAVMRELATYHYDPKKYEERIRERQNWVSRDDFVGEEQ